MSDRDEMLKEKMYMMNPDKVDRELFLDAIAQIESSNGQNTNHPEIQSGIHEGQSALGRYGLMPNTIKETVNRARQEGQATTPMRQLASQDPAIMKDMIQKDPKVEFDLANQLARRVLNKYQDPEMAAYSWNQGTNLSHEEIQQRDYQNSDYVQKFRKLRKLLGGS